MMPNVAKSVVRILGKNASIAVLLFVIALVVRLVFIDSASMVSPIRADAAKYVTIAINLVEHGTYSQSNAPNPETDAFISPGYPLFLAAVHALKLDLSATYHAVLRIQAVLLALTASIVFLLAGLLLPLWAAITAGVLVAFSPHLVTISGVVLTEALFTFLLCLSVYLVGVGTQKQKLAFLLWGTAIIGVASLVRPAYLLFPVVVSFVILFDKRTDFRSRLKNVAMIALIAALVWSPWWAWKSDKPSSANAVALSFALGGYPDLIHEREAMRGFPYREDARFDEMSKDIGSAASIIWERARENPGKYAYWYTIGKPVTYWSWGLIVGGGDIYIYPVVSSIYSDSGFFRYTKFLFKHLHPLAGLMALAALVVLLKKIVQARGNTEGLIISCLVLGCMAYFTAIHTVLAPLPRYAIPVYPLLYVAALHFVASAVAFGKQARLKDAH